MWKSILLSSIGFMAATAASADAISSFRSLCLANAGDAAAIKSAGDRAGFKMREIGSNSFMGFNTRIDQSLQINAFTRNKFECAVTTSDMGGDRAVASKFFGALGLTQRQGQARGKIGGDTYTFKHDGRGGEAFVMFSN